jgi:uncharacterized protein YuzE
MRIQYDEKADALYLRLDEARIIESERINAGIVLDFDASENLVGIELLDFKRRVPKGFG